ncbi:DNA repair photolyase [Breznakia sp. PF5-3]|uniref:SPL family radical SAM protein n=1 Tax=unclassified Breznakia TaxID=2623764 RepID=UPI002406B641|nr:MULTISPECIES: radical SAM protein [unclassified Breznakia]MDL2276554.1 radical SAM protein [Breznakia sp. OttesenSCG-928-G09]MDF9825541.1 DNA repair photolyase [Breznakia sp. PM6-1]MDF9836415.1 DNA repair photolyase [Breznakia sp. PF5-3]MDF9838195.1 DNA repair photolyase [Breznakia sp. PFB2-8]MDF9860212.1 DNA repair photolyase [Breznakia sp. PH5-24]
MKYTHIQSKTALHKLRPGRLPFDYDLNLYRGCAHGCIYCYAMYSHQYMESEAYFDEIFIKENIAEILEKELHTKKKGKINLGGVCDSYQPIEVTAELMPNVLKSLIKHKTPIVISTKSDLLLRDIELIKELSELAEVNIAATITTMNEDIRKKIEPGTVSSERRFQMLERLKKETNANVGVHLMPIIPYLTDTRENLEEIYRRANEIEADYVLPGIMYLRGKTRNVFFEKTEKLFPNEHEKLKKMYAYKYDRSPYKKALYTYINELRKTYGFNHSNKIDKKIKSNEQLKLF